MASELRQWQIFESLSKTNSKRLLVSLILLLRHLGNHGLIILFDELETLLLQSASVRNAAYENVRLLIDNAEQGHHLHVFFSIIPEHVVVDGELRKGTFVAQPGSMITKCPSKYAPKQSGDSA